VVVADTDGSGFLPADAGLQVNEAGVGLPAPNLASPPIPSGVHFQSIASNVDPSVRIPTSLQVAADAVVAASGRSTGRSAHRAVVPCRPRSLHLSFAQLETDD
jgi:hypothetical protein